MADFIILAIVLVILAFAIRYIVKAKKSGVKCIGCPSGSTCSHGQNGSGCNCGCSGEGTCGCNEQK